MANFQCPYCRGWEIYQSKFRWTDIFVIPLGFPRRCDTCNERFYSWRHTPKRPFKGRESEQKHLE